MDHDRLILSLSVTSYSDDHMNNPQPPKDHQENMKLQIPRVGYFNA